MDFKQITIEDKNRINDFFFQNTFRNCDFSFSNIFCWRHKYLTTFCIDSGFLFFRFFAGGKKAGYMFPLGEGNLKLAIDELMVYAQMLKEPFRMYALSREMYTRIEHFFPGKFVYQSNPSWSEYIYHSQDMITLVGKKFQSKRNHINKFKRTYPLYEYLPITKEIIPECLNLYARWSLENGNDISLIDECQATQMAFEYFEQLGLKGGVIRVDGEIIAYSYGQPLGSDTFGVHAEKSLYEIEGGFSMINQQFALHECADFRFINREEDLGLETLRQAKMSYHPVFLIEKGFITELR